MKLVVCTLTFSIPFHLLQKEGETEESIMKEFGREFKTLVEEAPDGMRAEMECEIVETETEGARASIKPRVSETLPMPE